MLIFLLGGNWKKCWDKLLNFLNIWLWSCWHKCQLFLKQSKSTMSSFFAKVFLVTYKTLIRKYMDNGHVNVTLWGEGTIYTDYEGTWFIILTQIFKPLLSKTPWSQHLKYISVTWKTTMVSQKRSVVWWIVLYHTSLLYIKLWSECEMLPPSACVLKNLSP